MLDFQQKRKVRGIMYHRNTLIFLTCVVLFAIHSTWTVYQKKNESEEGRVIAQKRVSDFEERQGYLEQKIQRLGTAQGTEEEIRAKFSVAKENENLVIIVDDVSATHPTVPQRTFWQKLRSFFDKQ